MRDIRKARMWTVAAAFAAAFAFAAPASAQATRTWVSGVGDDVNPCSRTAPCKTFAGAISKTAAGGEINCLDPGGFGTVSITKSLTIDCTGTFGSALNSGGINGIVINDSLGTAPNSAKVVLRGISINGAGSTPGLNGVWFVSGASLVLENVLILNQSGSGVSIQPTSRAEFYAHNVTVSDSGGSTGAGVLIQPGTSGSVRAVLRNVRVNNAGEAGLRVDTTGNTAQAGTSVVIDDSSFAGGTNGIVLNAPGGTPLRVSLNDSTVANHSGSGIQASGSSVQMRVASTAIQGNGTGVTIGGGATVGSYQNNRLAGNDTDGRFSDPPVQGQ